MPDDCYRKHVFAVVFLVVRSTSIERCNCPLLLLHTCSRLSWSFRYQRQWHRNSGKDDLNRTPLPAANSPPPPPPHTHTHSLPLFVRCHRILWSELCCMLAGFPIRVNAIFFPRSKHRRLLTSVGEVNLFKWYLAYIDLTVQFQFPIHFCPNRRLYRITMLNGQLGRHEKR